MQAEERVGEGRALPENGSIPAALFLRRVIDALTAYDAIELHSLLQLVDKVTTQGQSHAISEARSLHRLLGALLKETERNLRLWRKAIGVAPRNSYGSIGSIYS